MSDRIDELEDAVNKMTFTMADTWFDGSDVDASARFAAKDAVMETVTELATIAREAIGDRDEWIDRCYQSDERALKAEAMCEWLVYITASHAVAANLLREDETRDEYKARLLKAASEAVKS